MSVHYVVAKASTVQLWRNIGTCHNPSVHDVYVQLSSILSPELRLLHLNKLLNSFRDDPDLSLVPLVLRPHVIQTLFISSGCDYISFFDGVGNATIMKHFFQNARFISGSHDIPGTLVYTDHDHMEEGFLSFVRLICTVCFRKRFPSLLLTHLVHCTCHSHRILSSNTRGLLR